VSNICIQKAVNVLYRDWVYSVVDSSPSKSYGQREWEFHYTEQRVGPALTCLAWRMRGSGEVREHILS